MLVIRRDSDWLESDLSRRRVFERCDVICLGPSQVLRKNAAPSTNGGIAYRDLDPNSVQLPASLYDVIWTDDVLGRVSQLDRLTEQIAQALQPSGFLFAYEYVGPSAMAIPAAQRKAAEAAFSLIPKRYRKSSRGRPIDHLELPPLTGYAEGDVPRNSSEIVRLLREHVEIAQCKPLGGTLLQFVLRDIAANFHGDDRSARGVLRMLFAIEDALVDTGELDSDFALLVGQRRRLPAGRDEHR